MTALENNPTNPIKEGDYKRKLIAFLRYPKESDKNFLSPRSKSLIQEIESDFNQDYEEIFGINFTVKFLFKNGQSVTARIGGINPANARLDLYRQIPNSKEEFTEASAWMYELEYKLEEYKQLLNEQNNKQ